MAFNTSFDASNAADFVLDISATDSETGDAIDFTDAEVSIKIKREGCSQVFSATIDDGITLTSSTILELTVPVATMATLQAGTYQIGAVYKINDATVQLFVGDFVVYDGIASL